MPIYKLKNIEPIIHKKSWVAPNASIIGKVELCENSNIWFGAVLRGDTELIKVGKSSNIQDNSVCHTDVGFPLIIGDNCTIGHNVVIHGCKIGNNSLIGIGSVIMNNAHIGKNCIIGSNSLITENKVIPDNSLVIGSPGRVIRNITETEAESLIKSSNHYVENWQRYNKELIIT